ncbi:hypothetical protein AVEN_232243-1 [Araneus ventricosus]|uniref:Uncharacterized protein n=1 Tax=Araneus ventricosus TaxID=182803 RepID=A0A4Y2J6Y2_ARAVE|nr:hypothetical protein AVEN_232243-1 [Araneus ventricosus]
MPPPQEGADPPDGGMTKEELRQIDALQNEMFQLSGYLTVTAQLYEGQPIPAPLKAKKDRAARTLRRKKANDNDRCVNVNESENCNVNKFGTTTNVKNYADGDNSQMAIDPVNFSESKLHVTENLNTSEVNAANDNEMHNDNDIGEFVNNDPGNNRVLNNVTVAIDNVQNSNYVWNYSDNARNVNMNSNSDNCFVYSVSSNDIHNGRIVNNCVVYDMPGSEITPDAESHVMYIDPPLPSDRQYN